MRVNSVFEIKVGSILEEEAPLRSYQHRSNFKSWLTPELKLQMEIRDTKRELARQTNDKTHWKEYRVERNKCSKNLHKADIDFHNNLYKKFKETHDVKNIYKTTRRLLNWKGGGGPQSFLKNGLLVRRPIDLANLQMEFFNNKVKGLISNLPVTNTNPLKWIKNSMESWKAGKVGRKLPIFKFRELTLLETVTLIGDLGNSTSFGTDLIDALAIKTAAVHLEPPIMYMINTSLKTLRYANKWKLSKLLPLQKSADRPEQTPPLLLQADRDSPHSLKTHLESCSKSDA